MIPILTPFSDGNEKKKTQTTLDEVIRFWPRRYTAKWLCWSSKILAYVTPCYCIHEAFALPSMLFTRGILVTEDILLSISVVLTAHIWCIAVDHFNICCCEIQYICILNWQEVSNFILDIFLHFWHFVLYCNSPFTFFVSLKQNNVVYTPSLCYTYRLYRLRVLAN